MPRKMPTLDRFKLAGLIVLALLPALTGAMSLSATASHLVLGTDGAGTDAATYVARPVPIFTHVIAGVAFALLGAFQVIGSFRARHHRAHKITGRALLPLGFIAALTALYMNEVFPPLLGPIKYYSNLGFGVVFLCALTLATAALVGRKYAQHGAWMLRAYALALGAGTQRLMFMPVFMVTGEIDPVTVGVILILGWSINLLVAEWVIRKPLRKAKRQPALA
ncbi:MAG: DUF2306 domain-containing protein [Maritimibacter sp.]